MPLETGDWTRGNAVLAGVAVAVLRHADPDRPWRGAVVMTGGALAVTTPHYSWYSLLLVAVVALDGLAEWLALAVAGYATIPHAGWLSYGAAVVMVTAAWLIRRANQEGGGGSGPATPAVKIIRARQPARLERQPAAGGLDEGQHLRALRAGRIWQQGGHAEW